MMKVNATPDIATSLSSPSLSPKNADAKPPTTPSSSKAATKPKKASKGKKSNRKSGECPIFLRSKSYTRVNNLAGNLHLWKFPNRIFFNDVDVDLNDPIYQPHSTLTLIILIPFPAQKRI